MSKLTFAASLLAIAHLLAPLAGCGSGGGHGAGNAGAAASPSGSSTSGAATAGATGATGSSTAPAPSLYAGAAAVDITPAVGTPLGGFGGTPRRVIDATSVPLMLLAIAGPCWNPNPNSPTTFFAPSTGVHDPIMARALIISNGQKKIGLLKLDTIAAARKIRDDLLPSVALLGIAPEDFLVCATHTHSGPAAVSAQKLWELIAMDCYSDLVYQPMLRGAVDALKQADAALRPAALGIGTMMEPNASENRRNRPGIYDPELAVVKVVEPGGAPIAALFNFAVHGTCSGASNMLFSADCMGEMERVIENGLGGGIAIFTNGAEGDVAPAHGGGFGGARQEGQIVGGDVLALWPQIAVKPWVEIKTAFQDFQMPTPVYNTGNQGCLPIPGTSQTLCDIIPGFRLAIPIPDPTWLSTTLPFQAIRIDDTVFATAPGEPETEIGWAVKALAKQKGFARGVVIALANDHGAYFTTLAEYVRGEYEGTTTLYGANTGQVVTDNMGHMMDLVK